MIFISLEIDGIIDIEINKRMERAMGAESYGIPSSLLKSLHSSVYLTKRSGIEMQFENH
jgi:hypothetical protein